MTRMANTDVPIEAFSELTLVAPAGLREMSWPELCDLIEAADAKRDAEFAGADLNIESDRVRLAAKHPMLDQLYFIKTDASEAFYQVVFDHAIARKSGLYGIGEHRVGKTKAIQYAVQRLRAELPFMAFFVYSAETRHRLNKAALCRDILKQWKYPLQQKQDPSAVLLRVLMTGAAQAGGHDCVLFIDEAQKLDAADLGFIAEIWNDLRPLFVLLTVLVGRPGLASNLLKITPADIRTRFFVKLFNMAGIRSPTALRDYLKAYDTILTYPEGSEWSYSRYFLRPAFDCAWRLENEALTFWDQLVQTSQAKPRIIKETGFRLAFVTDAIHTFLLDSMKLLGEQPETARTLHGSPERWAEVILAVTERDLIT